MLIKRKNKKGQVQSIFYFFIIAFILFMSAPILLQIPMQIFDKLIPIAGNQSAQAGQSVSYLDTKMTNLWDEMIVLLFMGNVALLFLTAFLVDVHPAFLILYIIAVACLFIFIMPIWDAVNTIYANANLSDATAVMPLTKFFIQNFPIVLLVIVILSGVLMYAKFKYFGGNQNSF